MGEGETQHRERISHNIAIAAREVTVEQFQRFLKVSPRVLVKNHERFSPVPTCPMNSVSWYDAAAYCNWLSKQDEIPEDQWCYGPNEQGDYADGVKLMSNAENRKGYRLPSGAEWEYSCRAGAATAYSFGEPWQLLEKYAWYNKNAPNQTQPVGSLKPNDLGLFDLHGNVFEWCQDALRAALEKEEKTTDTHISLSIFISDKHPRQSRGGSFLNPPAGVRSAIRNWYAPTNRHTSIGFRPARTYP